jgi:predicted nuclease of restriction endonuclease-like (RecB) superfamily/prophage antirepressor-like protein
MDNQLTVFEQKNIRQIDYNGDVYFSVVDIIAVLTESTSPRDYWTTMKRRDPQMPTICRRFKMKADDGKQRLTDCANTEGVFRILMSVPSPKVEPLKLWLSQGAKQEREKPQLLITPQKVVTAKDYSYEALIDRIGQLLSKGRQKAAHAVDNIMVKTYWQMGFEIVEYEQHGKKKAEFGTKLFDKIARDLFAKHGRTFSRSSLIYIRKFYLVYPSIGESTIHQLSWTHIIELLKVDDALERSFYQQQSIKENWKVKELQRQKRSSLFHRLALSKDKEGILKLAKQGQILEQAEDIIREPLVLDFLGMPDNYDYKESELEQRILDNLQKFLLELGRGFAFVGRQYRIPIANKNYKVDLVFYHYILHCFVIIDLKRGEVEHYDIGQMNMYLSYFKKEENTEGDNAPIGIILTAEKDNVLIEYALDGITNQILVSKYQLYLPNRDVLEAQIKRILERENESE